MCLSKREKSFDVTICNARKSANFANVSNDQTPAFTCSTNQTPAFMCFTNQMIWLSLQLASALAARIAR